MYGPIIALHKHDRRLDRSSDRDLLKLLFDEYDTYTFSVEQEVRLKELDNEHDIPLVEAVFDRSAGYDSFRRLVEANSQIFPEKYVYNKELLDRTFAKGHYHVWRKAVELHVFGSLDTKKLGRLCAEYGRIRFIRYLCKNGTFSVQDAKNNLLVAIEHGQFEYVKFMSHAYQNSFSTFDEYCKVAVKYGHVNILRYLLTGEDEKLPKSTYTPKSNEIVHLAVQKHDLACVQCAIENNCPYDIETIQSIIKTDTAPSQGLLDVIDYLINTLHIDVQTKEEEAEEASPLLPMAIDNLRQRRKPQGWGFMKLFE